MVTSGSFTSTKSATFYQFDKRPSAGRRNGHPYFFSESILHGAPLEVKTHINLRLVSEISSGFVDEQAHQGAMKLTAINIGVADVARKYFARDGKLNSQNLLDIKKSNLRQFHAVYFGDRFR